MKKSAELVLDIETLAQTGEGRGRIGTDAVLVPGTLPGERVRVLTSTIGRQRQVELLAIENASPARLVPPCPRVDRCGGCTWQHVPAEMQRDARLAQLRRALAESAASTDIEYVPAPAAYRYRSRARMAWRTSEGVVTLGYRARQSHEIVGAIDCVVLTAALEAALAPLRAALVSLPGAGEVSLAMGSIGAPVASLRPARLDGALGFSVPDQLVRAGFAGVALWAPGATAAAIAGDPRPVVTAGDGQPLWLAPEGFAQANEGVNALLAQKVCALAEPAAANVLELYAGAGNFTVLMARSAAKVVAVETDRGATDAMADNARARGLDNITVITDAAEHAAADRKADVVVLDPPRTGAREVCEAIARRPPKRLVYVSCDAPTLGRDVRTLAASMNVVSVTAFEMFPQTPHLEVVVRLDRRRGR